MSRKDTSGMPAGSEAARRHRPGERIVPGGNGDEITQNPPIAIQLKWKKMGRT